MQKLNAIIQKRLHDHNLHASARASEVVFRAQEYLDSYFPDHQNALRVTMAKGGLLYVKVSGSVWGQELWSVSDELLEKLQKKFGKKMVKRIQAISV